MISAGLVLVIYIIVLILLYHFLPGPSLMKYLVHLLPFIAAVMAWKGINNRDLQLTRERLIRVKRRHAEHQLKNQDLPSPPTEPPPPLDEEKK